MAKGTLVKEKQNISKNVAVFYGHCASNLGDLAINQGSLNLLRVLFPSHKITIIFWLSNDSQINKESLKFFTEAHKNNIEIIKFKPSHARALHYLGRPERFLYDLKLDSCDWIIINSGEHLFSYDVNPNFQSLFWRTIPLLSAKYLEKNTMILPSTFGPFQTKEVSQLMYDLTSEVDIVAIREVASKEYLEQEWNDFGTIGSGVLTLDPAFFIKKDADMGALENSGYSFTIGFAMRSENVGIRIGSPQNKDINETKAFKILTELIRKLLRDENIRIILFEQTTSDASLCQEILKNMGNISDRLGVICSDSVQKYIADLSACDLVVSNRFHALILSLLSNTNVLPLWFANLGNKIPGLCGVFEELRESIELSGDTALTINKIYSVIKFEQDAKNLSNSYNLEKYRKETLKVLNESISRVTLQKALVSTKKLEKIRKNMVLHFADYFVKQVDLHMQAKKQCLRKIKLKERALNEQKIKFDQQIIEKEKKAKERIYGSYSYRIGNRLVKLLKLLGFPLTRFLRT